MLTQTVAGRTFDYSYCVGGRMAYPSAIALGSNDTVYVLLRGSETIPNVPASRATSGANIGKFTIGTSAGDEELLDEIGKTGQGEGEITWPAGIEKG